MDVGGGETMRVDMAAGEGNDLCLRALEGVITRRDGREERIKFPYDVRAGMRAAGGNRIYKFMGSREAPVAELTVAREPALAVFYVACFLFAVGVVAASLFRYDELVAYVREGRVYLAARSNKGADVIKPAFDEWVARAKKEVRGDAV